MSGVDVLAVMDRAFCYAQNNCVYEDVRELDAARAAVAELIQANAMFVHAVNEMLRITPDRSDDYIYDVMPSSELARSYFAARNALSRVRGAE